MRKLLPPIAVLLLSAFMGQVCAADPAVAGKEVTMILKNLTNPFFITVKEGGERAAAELGINLSVLAPLKADNNEEQTHMVEQAIVTGADLVIMCPSDTMGIIPAMEKLKEAGIPVINLNTRIGGDEKLAETLVAIENVECGRETVRRLATMMGGKGELILLEGVSGAQTSIDRIQGAHEALAQFPDIKVVAQQPADYNRAKAMDVTQNLLQAFPNTTGIYCCNDEMALGAVEAIESAGKTGKILVAGSDANADARKAIQNGKMHLTCDTDPFNQGYQSVIAAARALAGEELPPLFRVSIKVLGKEDL
ncbi:MAG: sugar ABC transporter substrate-binding protein [Planctomycetota bacterium]|jgi:ABC-type sugar transport system substrate-binding protein|nr:sugar ABC transporter substrate-binding protein [Planctomycetota bacterium]